VDKWSNQRQRKYFQNWGVIVNNER